MKTWHIISLCAALLLAALIHGGVYSVRGTPHGRVYVINRFTRSSWYYLGSTHYRVLSAHSRALQLRRALAHENLVQARRAVARSQAAYNAAPSTRRDALMLGWDKGVLRDAEAAYQKACAAR